ncbi:hypothetical protein LV89_03841 [Arcicella aurantiaca]|uniref:Uncharacterized protein n=1 Tax=Arcicella aurantiaca TaxID=591202 RepID=A0A316DS42_9BACT|nr:hypothetical protein [Arcicella aurantiaca]PWK20298.1 hypothetical protein LV89_03841 [Arcicella aurantiaca]
MATYQIKKQIYNAIKWTGDNKEEVESFISDRNPLKFCDNGDIIIQRIYGRCYCSIGDYILEDFDESIIIVSNYEFNKKYELWQLSNETNCSVGTGT